jgi:ATP-binding cassette subfamily F protein uup
MSLLSLHNAHLSFGDHPLLDHVSLTLVSGDRLGVIGRNGAGKSSLLKVLAGIQPLDDGVRHLPSDLRLRFVPQESDFAEDDTIASVLSAGLDELVSLHQEYNDIIHACENITDNQRYDQLLNRLQEVQTQLDLRDAWRLEDRLTSAIDQFGLAGDTRVSDLSGGWKKRLVIAQAMLAKPDVLLLDEPTNHLDVAGIEQLEQQIKSFQGAVVVISHDRRFLDQVVTGLLELDRGVLRTYPGSFSQYQQRKAEELASEAITEALFDKFLAQEEVWIRQGIKARRTRNEGRVRRLESLRVERAERRQRQGMAKLTVDAGKKSGALVAELTNVSLSLDGWCLFNEFSTLIQRGDKVGFIGPNGVGKTTLIKLILGQLQPDTGQIKQGTQLQVAYLDQQRAQLNDEDTLIDAVREGSDYIEIMGQKKHILGYLEDFLFPPHRARVKVGSLSGGERARLLLAKLFTKPANLLILDEPTNDLDLETLELLEELLQSYAGTVLLVSHDRAFLDNVVTQSLCFVGEGSGQVIEVTGGYEDWLAIRHQYTAKSMVTPKPEATVAPTPAPTPAPTTATASVVVKKVKLSYKEQKLLDSLPDQIAELENEQSKLSEQLSDPSVFADTTKVHSIQTRLAEIDDALVSALEQWEMLESKAAGKS